MRPLALDNLIENLQQLDRRVQQALPNHPLQSDSQLVVHQQNQSSIRSICHVCREFHQARLQLGPQAEVTATNGSGGVNGTQ